MADKHGELYFITEENVITGKRSNYVKIGIVKGSRTTESRISEHQTGNPRNIVELHVLNSPMVQSLETLIHRVYALNRVRGEWFYLDEQELSDVLDFSNNHIKDQERHLHLLEEASRLSREVSTEPEKAADEKALKLHEELVRVRCMFEEYSKHKDLLKLKIESATGLNAGVDGVSIWSVPAKNPSFDSTRFKKENEELYTEYLVTKQSFSRRFSLRNMPKFTEINESLEKEIKSFDKFTPLPETLLEGAVIQRDSKIEELHVRYLLLQREVYKLNWEKEKLEAALQVHVANSEGIEGVCSWNGKNSESAGFDKEAFKASNKDLYVQYLKPGGYNTPKILIEEGLPYIPSKGVLESALDYVSQLK